MADEKIKQENPSDLIKKHKELEDRLKAGLKKNDQFIVDYKKQVKKL